VSPLLPIIIFGALSVLVVTHFIWQEWRLRREREQAAQEFQRLMLKQHQEAVAQAEMQQQILFNSMLEGVLILDAHGRVRLTNQSLKRLFGITTEIRGRTVMEAFRLAELGMVVERLTAEETIQDFELDIPTGRRRCVQINAAVISSREGIRQGFTLVFHDLTRLKELEETRKEFVANVSHELRTPLSMIKGFAETLLDGAKDNPEVSTRFLQNIDKHADRLLYLIEDLLTISRLESKRDSLNKDSVPLWEIANRVFFDLQKPAAEKALVLENRIPAELFVWADADRLQQVFLNLVDNAIKYGKSNGRVITKAREVDGNHVEIAVEDDGPGIPPDAQERIFERFYRVDKARARENGGTGLGLAIVKHIVLAHDGKVWVKSQPGQGSAFYFTLPKRDQN
jgi:two-component system phosphate regulon sensor histidine kinase PhoR